MVTPGTGGEGGEVPQRRVGVLRRVRRMRRRLRQLVRVQWLFGVSSRFGVGLEGPLVGEAVAGQIRFSLAGGSVPGGRWGSGVERLVGGAATPCAGAVLHGGL